VNIRSVPAAGAVTYTVHHGGTLQSQPPAIIEQVSARQLVSADAAPNAPNSTFDLSSHHRDNGLAVIRIT